MSGNRLLVVLVTLSFASFACQDEPEPTFPPEFGEADVVCAEAVGSELPLLERVDVPVSDSDQDLLSGSVEGWINGLPMTLADDDADQVYTWTPPESFDPPMICSGDFSLVLSAEDAEGQKTEETQIVSR